MPYQYDSLVSGGAPTDQLKQWVAQNKSRTEQNNGNGFKGEQATKMVDLLACYVVPQVADFLIPDESRWVPEAIARRGELLNAIVSLL